MNGGGDDGIFFVFSLVFFNSLKTIFVLESPLQKFTCSLWCSYVIQILSQLRRDRDHLHRFRQLRTLRFVG